MDAKVDFDGEKRPYNDIEKKYLKQAILARCSPPPFIFLDRPSVQY